MSAKNTIQCPNCTHEFAVEEAFFLKAEERIKQEYQKKLEQQRSKFKEQQLNLSKEKEAFEQYKLKEKEIFEKHLQKKLEEQRLEDQKRLDEERKLLVKNIEDSLKSNYELQLAKLQEENETRKKENRELKSKEVELLQLQKNLKEREEDLELTLQKKFFEKSAEIEAEARKKEREALQLKEKEYQKQLEDQRKLIEEMQRKAEQGSMQLQGEVLELELEALLNNLYPFDHVEEVPKGFRGADVIQTVINNSQSACGKIIYETKRTKSFEKNWLVKLKQDQLSVQADIAVLVTQTMPKELDQFGYQDGVWICRFSEVQSVTYALRHMLVKLYSSKKTEENKTDKMALIYSFVTSEEFKQRIETIVLGFTGLKEQLEKEKRAMARIWKEREKQIDLVIENTIDIYGSVKGIAGPAISTIDALELSPPEE